MKNLICALSIFSCTLPVFAVRPDAPAESSEPAKPEANATELSLKTKSSFTMDESGHNPFWPVGWRPVAKVATSATGSEHSVQDISPTAFAVTSITVDRGGSFAIINGKVMNEGQVFGLQLGNQTYQLTVKAIQDGQVVLQRRDQEIVVPLKRR